MAAATRARQRPSNHGTTARFTGLPSAERILPTHGYRTRGG